MSTSYPEIHLDESEILDLTKIVPKLQAAWFSLSRRFNKIRFPSSLKVIAETQWFDEGDWWAIAVVSLEFDDGSSAVAMLPFKAIIVSDAAREFRPAIDTLLMDNPEYIAFGFVSQSKVLGDRKWLAYDAFLDESFADTILGLFWADECFEALEVVNRNGTVAFTPQPDFCDYFESHDSSIWVDDNGHVFVRSGALTLAIPPTVSGMRGQFNAEERVVGKIECDFGDQKVTLAALLMSS